MFSANLAEQGLNLQAVIPINSLSAEILGAFENQGIAMDGFRQLLLLGHGGRRLWERVQASGDESDQRVDEYTCDSVAAYFGAQQPECRYQILYPGHKIVPLQALGELAGWHFNSPLMVGVNSYWGSWFAYRALVLADTDLPATTPPGWQSACDPCADKPCIGACPAAAVTSGGLDMGRCIAFRKSPGSPCKDRCLARLACPAGTQHRYSEEQLSYHYLQSYRTICRSG